MSYVRGTFLCFSTETLKQATRDTVGLPQCFNGHMGKPFFQNPYQLDRGIFHTSSIAYNLKITRSYVSVTFEVTRYRSHLRCEYNPFFVKEDRPAFHIHVGFMRKVIIVTWNGLVYAQTYNVSMILSVFLDKASNKLEGKTESGKIWLR